jgi:hypothetical protein
LYLGEKPDERLNVRQELVLGFPEMFFERCPSNICLFSQLLRRCTSRLTIVAIVQSQSESSELPIGKTSEESIDREECALRELTLLNS